MRVDAEADESLAALISSIAGFGVATVLPADVFAGLEVLLVLSVVVMMGLGVVMVMSGSPMIRRIIRIVVAGWSFAICITSGSSR